MYVKGTRLNAAVSVRFLRRMKSWNGPGARHRLDPPTMPVPCLTGCAVRRSWPQRKGTPTRLEYLAML